MAGILTDGIEFFSGDATEFAPFNYTHIYMYDCIFSEATYHCRGILFNTIVFSLNMKDTPHYYHN